MLRRYALAVVFASILAVPADAATIEFALSIPDVPGATVTLKIPVEHPGRVAADTSWSPSRILAFRLAPPGDTGPVIRRSGPSPQSLEALSDDATLAAGPEWTLTILASAAGKPAQGVVTVIVPEAPDVVAAREAALLPPPPPPPEPPHWARPAAAPAGVAASLATIFDAVEGLRARVFRNDPRVVDDACGWQADALRWLVERRDEAAMGDAPPAKEVLLFLSEGARAVSVVEDLRVARDPIRVGPPPEDALRRRAWAAARRDVLGPIERRLDAVSEAARGAARSERAPALWALRWTACLTASERQFDARLASGSEVSGSDLAAAQWDVMLAAARAFEALAEHAGTPLTP